MKSQEIFGFSLSKICDNLIHCELVECNLDHPRCLVGICISFLKGNCKIPQCVFLHPKPKDLRQIQQVTSIMGVYSFNLCKEQQSCQIGRECKFQHRTWANNICINHLNNECEEDGDDKHIDWLQLQKNTNENFNINEYNPENICDSNKQDCQCKNYQHPKWATEMCVLYLKGKCRSIKSCTKKHIVWEDYQKDRNLIKMNKQTVKPCSKVNLIGAQVEESKTQSFSLYCQNEEEIIKIGRMKLQMKLKYNVDLLIIMDCTGSMSQWINQAQSTISSTIDKVKRKSIGYLFRVAFVGYRDFCDKEKRIVFHDFTEKIPDIKEFIKQQKAEGGGDDAEDVIGGLSKGLELNICKHPDSILCTILIADAPSHGKQYHNDDVKDDYNNEIEEGTLEKLMKKYKDKKANIFFTCIAINKHTDKMYKIMKAEFPTLSILENGKPENFSSDLKYTLKSSIKQSAAYVSQLRSHFIINAKYKIIEFPPLKESECDDEYWQNFPQLLNESIKEGQTTLRIDKKELDEISDPNFQKGATSCIFKFYDTTNNRYMVGKLPKELVDHNNQLNSALPNSYEHKQLQIEIQKKVDQAKNNSDSRFYSQAYSYQLAKAYRYQCRNIKGAPPIFYTSPVIYELEREFMGTKYIYAESYIDLNCEWKKYTNNARGCSQKHYYYTSFTHFSFQETGGRLMITDLQGKSNILTDPVVHSDKLDVIKDICQNGEAGYQDFSQSQHLICSILCQKLHLNRKLFESYDADLCPTDPDEQDETFNQKIMDIKDTDIIHIICEWCYEFRDTTYQEYQQQIQNSDKIKCKQCIEELKQEFESTCQCCENAFKFNQFREFKINRSLPKICNECISQCKQKSNKCLYCQRTCNSILKREKVSGILEYICKYSRQYLNCLQCNQCNKNFNYSSDKWPSIIQYNSQEFVCRNCCNKSR